MFIQHIDSRHAASSPVLALQLLRGSGCLSRCQGIISAISPIPASVKCHCSAASADEGISQWLTAVPGIRALHGTLLSLKFK